VTVVAAPCREIDTPTGQLVKRRPFLRDVDRVVDRQHDDGRCQPQAGRGSGDIGQHDRGHRHAAAPVEVVLADPGRVEPKLLGQHRLVAYLHQELLGRTRIVGVAIVAQCEVAEFHGGGWLPRSTHHVSGNEQLKAKIQQEPL